MKLNSQKKKKIVNFISKISLTSKKLEIANYPRNQLWLSLCLSLSLSHEFHKKEIFWIDLINVYIFLNLKCLNSRIGKYYFFPFSLLIFSYLIY